MSTKPSPPLQTSELRITDENGQARICLSATDGVPSIRLLKADGATGAALSLDREGRPSLSFENISPDAPTVVLEIDGKGAHIKMDRAGGASAYFFLNNSGGSGIVFYDAVGQRRLNLMVAADGAITITPIVPDGS